MCTGFIGGTETNNRFAHQQRRLICHRPRRFDSAFNRSGIMTINATHHMPAISLETLYGIIGKPALDMTIDRDTIIIIERHQLAQLQRTRQRTGFMGDPFHHATIPHKGIGIMINDLMTGTVKLGGEGFFSDRHPHGICNALPQWLVVVSTPGV